MFLKVWVSSCLVCLQLQSLQENLPLAAALHHFHLSNQSLILLTSSLLSCAGALHSCRYFCYFPEVWGLQENWLENFLRVLQKNPKPKPNTTLLSSPPPPPFLILQRGSFSSHKNKVRTLTIWRCQFKTLLCLKFPCSGDSMNQVNGLWVLTTTA